MARWASPKPYVSKSAFRESLIAHELTNRAMPQPRPRPVLGSRVMAVPVLGDVEALPQQGTVTYIHDAHQWYEVTFDAGYRNCYKWGETK